MSDLVFSVVVITYNQEKYISQTLDSILNQEHNYPFEIVVGEDCSTDNTKQIIEEYVKKYPEIIKPIYNNPNLGLIKNYFNTLSHCSGKYIMECAGDDYWLPGKVRTQIEFMEKNPDVGMCYGKVNILNESKNCMESGIMGSDFISFDNLILHNSIPAVTVCCKNKILKNYIQNINPIEKNWCMEDYPIWIWICKNSRIVFLDNIFSVYRALDDSISHSVNIEKLLEFAKSNYEVRKFFSEGKKLKSIENRYFEEIAYKYELFNDIKNYRFYLKKSDSTVAKIKLFCSYVPFYFFLKKLLGK